jgi:predicted GNAT family N-acyltransferase
MQIADTQITDANLQCLDALNIQVLRTREERMTVAHLRTLADTTTEYQTDPDLAALEEVKDEIGLVMALKLGEKPIGTIRFTPAGHNMTVTERFWGHASAGTELVGPDSWEAGRLIMSPEHRRGDLLPLCMAKAFTALIRHTKVRHLHGSTHMRLMRLYRRFGFHIHTVFTTSDGKKCALLHGEVNTVARALKINLPVGYVIGGPMVNA